jgi:sec-independent protein translocase protein TatB
MLPGLGFSEVLVLGVIALLVVGPKDLPLMLRKLGRQMARLRGLAAEFRSGFDELARQAELDELKKEVEALRRGQVFTDIEMEAMRTLEPLPPRVESQPVLTPPVEAGYVETGDPALPPDSPPAPPPAPPEHPPSPPQEAPPQAPPEMPPISPPAPTGPEPATAKLVT